MSDPQTGAPQRTAIIIGAGPAGLTAAYELLTRANVRPIVLEATDQVGGLSRTVVFKGNRIDIGGHRFFTKADRVMDWWLKHMPIDHGDQPVTLTYHHQQTELRTALPGSSAGDAPGPRMIVRDRVSRVYYLRQFFNYPISFSADTLRKLGLKRTFLIGISYTWARLFQIRPERNLEEFFVNRFGRRLYLTFFRDYTEKVWACRAIRSAPNGGHNASKDCRSPAR